MNKSGGATAAKDQNAVDNDATNILKIAAAGKPAKRAKKAASVTAAPKPEPKKQAQTRKRKAHINSTMTTSRQSESNVARYYASATETKTYGT